MCGITGILNLHHAGVVVDEVNLRQMLAMIRHRGPDQFGIYIDQQVGLGSARLSILDLTGGQQPISNEDESLWIVFNGEIFNYVELRPRLEARGHRFMTNTDTEVLLHLYEDYGPDCLQFLNGQFAIAIWDHKAQSLFLARDRLGIRPLFYTVSNNTLIFGSEIKAILAHPQARAEIDPVALDQVFSFWSTISPRTAFREIYQIPPGHWLLAKDGRISIQRYWELQFPIKGDGIRPDASHKSLAETLKDFRELLIDATQIRLRADVPVGAYLSGGLDSSVTSAIIRYYTNSHLDTFSITFENPEFDEGEFQRRMAKFLGTNHHIVHARHADIGRVFPEVIWHCETPITRTAPVPMYLLSKLVGRNHYKVVMTGEGADEFLAGYDIYKEAKIRRFWARQPESKLRPLLLQKLYPEISAMPSRWGYLTSFYGVGLQNTQTPEYSHSVRWRNSGRSKRFFSEELRQQVGSTEGTEDAVFYPPDYQRWDALAQAQYLEVTIFLSQYLLSSQGDRMAMANSVEGRYPFLDYRVVEFCNNLPPDWKLYGLNEKYLLRQLAKEWLPADIWQRRKRPYRAPIHRSFFNEETPDYVNELLSQDAVKTTGLFKPEAIQQMVQKVSQGSWLSETDDMALAGILSTQLVYQQFISNFRMPPPLSSNDDVKVCIQ